MSTKPIDYDALEKQALTPEYSPEDIQGFVRAAAKKHGVDEDLALKVAHAENAYRPTGVSTKGAIGPMQLMPGTAEGLGVDPNDPQQNVEGGVRYLGQMLKKYGGDKRKALAAYNFGPGNVDQEKPWPAETQAYVSKILGGDPKSATAAQSPHPIDYDALEKQALAPLGPEEEDERATGPDHSPEEKRQSYQRTLDWLNKNPLSSLPAVPKSTRPPDPMGEPILGDQDQPPATTPATAQSLQNQPADGRIPSAAISSTTPSRENIELMRRNLESLYGYANQQAAELEDANRQIGIGNLPGGGNFVNPEDLDSYNKKVIEHQALVQKIQAQAQYYQQQVDAFNRDITLKNVAGQSAGKMAVPGMEQLGGGRPGAASPQSAAAANARMLATPRGTDAIRAAWEAKYGVEAPGMPTVPEDVGTAFTEEANKITGGLGRVGAGIQNREGNEVAGGASDVIRGVTGAYMRPQALGPMIAASPLGAPLTMGAGMVAQKGTEQGLKSLGASPEVSALGGDLIGLAVAGGGARYLIGRADAALEAHNARAETLLEQESGAGRSGADIDSIFAGDSHPITVNGQNATLEYVPSNETGAPSTRFRAQFRVITDDGTVLGAGTGQDVAEWLRANGAAARVPGGSVAESEEVRLGEEITRTAQERSEAMSARDKARNTGQQDLYAESVLQDATERLGQLKRQLAGVQRGLPQVDYAKLAEEAGGKEVGPPTVDYDALAKKAGGTEVGAPTSPFSPSSEGGKPEAHEFSSTHVNLPEEPAIGLRLFGLHIPDSQLQTNKGDEGLDLHPHVTALYGLHAEDAGEVRKLLADQGPITLRLGKASVFPADDKKDFDVLKVDVDSPDLHKINGKLRELPHTNDFPQYHPHVTIAYLKPGQGKEYDGREIPGVTGQEITLDRLTFSSKNGQQIEIPLAGNPQKTTQASGAAVEKPQSAGPSATSQTQQDQSSDAKLQQIAARLHAHATGVADLSPEELKATVDEGLALRKAMGPEREAEWQSTVGEAWRAAASASMAKSPLGRKITPETPVWEMSPNQFLEHRPEQALEMADSADVNFARNPDQWTKDHLLALKNDRLSGIATLHGLPTSGTKGQIVQRLLNARDMADRFKGKTAEGIAQEMTGARIDATLRELGAPLIGNKLTKAQSILGNIESRTRRGELAVAEHNHRRAIARAVKAGEPVPDEVLEKYRIAKPTPGPEAEPVAEFEGVDDEEIIKQAAAAFAEEMGLPKPKAPEKKPPTPKQPKAPAAPKPAAKPAANLQKAKLDAAADAALAELRAMMAEDEAKPQFSRDLAAAKVDPKYLVKLATVGARQIANGHVDFDDWAGSMRQEAADVVEWVARKSGNEPDAVLRKVYEYADAVAKQFGFGSAVSSEIANPAVTAAEAEPGRGPRPNAFIEDSRYAAEDASTGQPGGAESTYEAALAEQKRRLSAIIHLSGVLKNPKLKPTPRQSYQKQLAVTIRDYRNAFEEIASAFGVEWEDAARKEVAGGHEAEASAAIGEARSQEEGPFEEEDQDNGGFEEFDKPQPYEKGETVPMHEQIIVGGKVIKATGFNHGRRGKNGSEPWEVVEYDSADPETQHARAIYYPGVEVAEKHYGVIFERGAHTTGRKADETAAPSGPIPSGTWMNEWDIEQAVDRYKNHPVLSRATKFLADFREETNDHSDGWHSWPLPGHAAKQLMGMIQHPEYATEANFKKALAPIRAFYTKRGTAAGMKFPEIGTAAPAKQTLPAAHPLAGITKPLVETVAPAAHPHRKGSKIPTGPIKHGPVKPFTASEPVRAGDDLTVTYTRPDHPEVTLKYDLAKGLQVSVWNNDYSQVQEIEKHFSQVVAGAKRPPVTAETTGLPVGTTIHHLPGGSVIQQTKSPELYFRKNAHVRYVNDEGQIVDGYVSRVQGFTVYVGEKPDQKYGLFRPIAAKKLELVAEPEETTNPVEKGKAPAGETEQTEGIDQQAARANLGLGDEVSWTGGTGIVISVTDGVAHIALQDGSMEAANVPVSELTVTKAIAQPKSPEAMRQQREERNAKFYADLDKVPIDEAEYERVKESLRDVDTGLQKQMNRMDFERVVGGSTTFHRQQNAIYARLEREGLLAPAKSAMFMSPEWKVLVDPRPETLAPLIEQHSKAWAHEKAEVPKRAAEYDALKKKAEDSKVGKKRLEKARLAMESAKRWEYIHRRHAKHWAAEYERITGKPYEGAAPVPVGPRDKTAAQEEAELPPIGEHVPTPIPAEQLLTYPRPGHVMSFFTGSSRPEIREAAQKRTDIGVVVTPARIDYLSHLADYPMLMVDNGAFSKEGFKPGAFKLLLNSLGETEAAKPKIAFVVAPDVVADAAKTLELFREWGPEIRGRGFPVAFVAQNGLEKLADQIPWDDFDVLFVGGTDEWKLGTQFENGGPDAHNYYEGIVLEAKRRGKPVHVGRVNSFQRMEHVQRNWFASSGDGTFVAHGPAVNTPQVIDWLDAMNKNSEPLELNPNLAQQRPLVPPPAPTPEPEMTPEQKRAANEKRIKELEQALAGKQRPTRTPVPEGLAWTEIPGTEEARKEFKDPADYFDAMRFRQERDKQYIDNENKRLDAVAGKKGATAKRHEIWSDTQARRSEYDRRYTDVEFTLGVRASAQMQAEIEGRPAPEDKTIPSDHFDRFWNGLQRGDRFETPEGYAIVTKADAFLMQPILPGPKNWHPIGGASREVNKLEIKLDDGSRHSFDRRDFIRFLNPEPAAVTEVPATSVTPPSAPQKGSFKVDMPDNGGWVSNGQRWATAEEAQKAGNELFSRWMGMKSGWKVVPSDEPVNWRWDDENYRGVMLDKTPAAPPEAPAAAEATKFKEGDRVRWKDYRGQEVTGEVLRYIQPGRLEIRRDVSTETGQNAYVNEGEILTEPELDADISAAVTKALADKLGKAPEPSKRQELESERDRVDINDPAALEAYNRRVREYNAAQQSAAPRSPGVRTPEEIEKSRPRRTTPPEQPTAPAAAHPLSDAAKAARDRLRAKRGDKPQFSRDLSLPGGVKIDKQDLIDLATIGAEHMVVNSVTSYQDWLKTMTADVGDLLPANAHERSALLRTIHAYASATAKQFGVTPEPAQAQTEEEPNAGPGDNLDTGGGKPPIRPEDSGALEGVSPENVRRPGAEAPPVSSGAGGDTEDGGDVREPAAGEHGGGSGAGTGLPGVVPPSQRRGPTQPHIRSSPAPSGSTLDGDFSLTPEEAQRIETGGARVKARNNLAAIRTIKEILAQENRPATLEEQQAIARYVGWGDSELANGIFGHKSEWAGINEDLKSLLTPEEYETARDSVINAHFTRLDLAGTMWDAARSMGFRAGGSVAELGMGIGNFFITMPEDLRPSTSRTGVEMDLITGAMAKALYPGSNILVKPMQETNLPDNYYDLIIGNFPFGKTQINDPHFKRYPFLLQNIHNYFFAKAIEKLRPGGIMLVITSRYTLDGGGPSEAFRRWMGERAEFLGAVRLPRDTFLRNAGTSVTTDVIALRRRIPNDPLPASTETWEKAPEIETKDGYKVNVNEYFQRHPEMMMGEMRGGTQYHKGFPELFGEYSNAKLKELLGRLPQNVLASWDTNPRETGDLVENYPEASFIKEGAFAIVKGNLVRRDGAYFRPVDYKEKRADRARGLIELRGAAREVIRSQDLEQSEEAILAARAELNRVYDSFIRTHGPINTYANVLVFADDPDWPLLTSLEDWDKGALKAIPQKVREKATGAKNAKAFYAALSNGDVVLIDGSNHYKVATKRQIFRERTIQRAKAVDHVDSAADALSVSLNELARMDWDRMQELTGRDPEDLQHELAGQIYRNPITKQWETADEYLSGNVRKKLSDAEFAARDNPELQVNVDALRTVLPKDREPGRIHALPGANWIPDQVYSQFMREALKVDAGEGEDLVKFIPQTGTYAFYSSPFFTDQGAAASEYRTPYFQPLELLEMLMNGRSPVARDTWKDIDGHEHTTKNPDATIEAVEKQQMLGDAFTKWIWSDPARTQAMARKYNDERNNLRLREYDGSHQTFPGLNTSWMRNGTPDPHQKNAVWRTLQSGNTLYAHVVGAGKTLEAVITAMELRRLGLGHKPMIAVPNHLVGQWQQDWMRAYPGAQLLVPTKKDFEKDNRQKLMTRIATGNYDGVIVGHKSFEKLPVKKETFKAFMDKELKEVNDALDTARMGKSKEAERKDPTIKALIRRKKSLQARLEKRLKQEEKDNAIFFEELGVDWLFVDEADLFKNLGYMTQMDRLAGLNNSDSGRSNDMLMKTHHISRMHGGRRGVVFMTGTPVSNSIAEVWTMMRYLMPDYLEQENMDQFDSWFKTFAKKETRMEVAPEGGRFIPRTRASKFVNASDLMNMFRLVADIKTGKQLNLPTPAVDTGGPQDIVAKGSEALGAFVQWVGARADAIRSGAVKPDEDCMLEICSAARKASLDMRLVKQGDFAEWLREQAGDDAEAHRFVNTLLASMKDDDPNSKANQAVKNILKIHRQFDEHKATQLVFLDLSTPKSDTPAKAKKANVTEIANAPEKSEEAAAENIYGEKEEAPQEEVETAEEAAERFTVYSDIRKKLIAGGMKPEEIAFIHDAKTDDQKIALFENMNAGRVRVMIGSTEKMGAGMNVQKRLIALHHLDAPWRPRDMEQREGRIKRQGNMLWDEHKLPVSIFRYQTEGSFDAFMWETIVAKARPIEQLMEGDPSMDEVDELSPVVMSYEQAKAVSSGNPLIREKILLDQEVHKLEVMRGAWLTEQATVSQQLAGLPAAQGARKQNIADLEADIATREANPGLVVNGQTYAAEQIRKDGAAALVAALRALGPIETATPLEATYRGFALEATPATSKLSGLVITAGKGEAEDRERRAFIREETPDGKFLYSEVDLGARSAAWEKRDSHRREDIPTTAVSLPIAEVLHKLWEGSSAFKSNVSVGERGQLVSAIIGRKVAGVNSTAIPSSWDILTNPDARLIARSGKYKVAVNYTAPAGTIASADHQIRFEETLHWNQAEAARNEKQIVELETRAGRPFTQEERLRTALRRQQELANELGEGKDDLNALRASEEGEDPRNPLAPLLKDPNSAIDPEWLPFRKYFVSSHGGLKSTAQGRVVNRYLAVRHVLQHGRKSTSNGYWVIDHLPTGLALGPQFDSGVEAVAFARYAGRELDFNFSKLPEGFQDKFRDVERGFVAPKETPAQSKARLKPEPLKLAADKPAEPEGEDEGEEEEGQEEESGPQFSRKLRPTPGTQPWQMPAEQFRRWHAVHFDLRPNAAERVTSIMSGLKGTGNMAQHDWDQTPAFNYAWSHGGAKAGAHAYVFADDAWRGKSPYLKEGAKPIAHVVLEGKEPVHKALVREALRAGEPVPAEIIKEYPDLEELANRPQFEREDSTRADVARLSIMSGLGPAAIASRLKVPEETVRKLLRDASPTIGPVQAEAKGDTVLTNRAGMRALAKAWGEVGLLGVKLQRGHVAFSAQALREAAPELAAAIERAAAHAETIVIVDKSRGLGHLAITLRHERFHIAQDRLKGHLGKHERQFLSHPAARAAVDRLRTSGYRDSEIALELGAHLAAGQWRDLGLTRSQARDLFIHYMTLLDLQHGQESVDGAVKSLAPMMREVFNARGTNRATNQEQPDQGPRGLAQGKAKGQAEGRAGPGIRRDVSGGPEYSRLGIDKFVEQDIVGGAKSISRRVTGGLDNIRTLLAPQTRGPKAMQGAGLVREMGAELAQRRDRALLALNTFKEYFETTPVSHRFDVIDAIETGDLGTLNATERAFVGTMRGLFTDREAEIKNLGLLKSFLNNYFPHYWTDEAKAEEWVAGWQGKRPMAGKESYRKQRKIPTIREGMQDPNFKLVPKYDNPVEFVLAKLAEEDRSITAHTAKQELLDKGDTKFVGVFDKAPEGWTQINDKIFTVYGKPTVTVTESFDALLRQRLEDLAGSLGIKHVRKPRIGGTRLGYTMQGGNTVVTRFASPDSVLAHEIGHQLEWRFHLHDLLRDRDYPERTKELRALADLRFEGSTAVEDSFKRYVREKDEKMANAIAALVYAPLAFRQVAPNTWDFLRDELWNIPALRPVFKAVPSMTLGVGSAEVPVGGMVTMGHYYSPEPLARIVNNYLSPGVKSSDLYKAWSAVNRTLNMIELGVSWFHGLTTTLNSSLSDMSLGIKQALAGHPIKGAVAAGRGFVPFASIVDDFFKGTKIQEAWDGKIKAPDPVTAAIVDALKAAGGAARQDPFWTTTFVETMKKAWREGNLPGAGIRMPFAVLEWTIKPVMAAMVPRAKMGAFAKRAQMELERRPNMTRDEMRETFGRIWDSMDNRFGQLGQRNLFMHGIAKDLMNAIVGRPGWSLGTVREFSGGFADLGRNVARIAGGKPPGELSDRTAYVIAAFIGGALLNVLLQLALTGELPKDPRDLVAPRDGGMNDDGSPSRVILPMYITKDIYGYARRPIETLKAKAAPAAHITGDMITNRDWKNQKIYGEGGQGVGTYLKGFVKPYSIQGAQQNREGGKSWTKTLLPFVGISPASRDMGFTPAERYMRDYHNERGPKTVEQRTERNKVQGQITSAARSGDFDKAAEIAQKGVEGGHITLDDANHALERALGSRMEADFKRLPLDVEVDTLRRANAVEKQTLMPIFLERMNREFGAKPADEQQAILQKMAAAGLIDAGQVQ